MAGTRRGTYGRLLLFAVLLLGVVTMHTVGHPAEHSGVHSPAAVHQTHVPPADSAHDETPPMSGMDPASVCLAVLGAFAFVWLLSVALGGDLRAAARTVVPVRPLYALRPNRPPPRLLLAQLSVLRI
ncbi:DUF6153 family protein [Streptomyces sp. GESEQ-35]|uniref:DUF6153 family protein n=1 Tax=Streptomyces sp. GESEQ-35 TaxID=2812657 RepID=UPI001B34326C|nr:DUF6153 family protein [Streptomyces sp. GESEQ-35]